LLAVNTMTASPKHKDENAKDPAHQVPMETPESHPKDYPDAGETSPDRGPGYVAPQVTDSPAPKIKDQ